MFTRSCRRRLLLDLRLSEDIKLESRWTEEEDKKLLCLKEEFGQCPWSFVSSHFSGQKSIADCYKRWKLIQSLQEETLSSPSREKMFPLEFWVDSENMSPSVSSPISVLVRQAADPQLENRNVDRAIKLSTSSLPEEKGTSIQCSGTSRTYIDPNSIQELVALYGSPVDMKQVCDDLLLFVEELSKKTEDHQTDPTLHSTQL